MSTGQGMQEPPEACRGEEGSPPERVQGVGSCQHPDFGLPVFRTGREVSVAFSHPAGGTLLQSPQEADAAAEAVTPPGQARACRLSPPLQRPQRGTAGLGRLARSAASMGTRWPGAQVRAAGDSNSLMIVSTPPQRPHQGRKNAH